MDHYGRIIAKPVEMVPGVDVVELGRQHCLKVDRPARPQDLSSLVHAHFLLSHHINLLWTCFGLTLPPSVSVCGCSSFHGERVSIQSVGST